VASARSTPTLSAAPALPWYRPIRNECEIFATAWNERLPLLLKGPTGCGKTRLVEHMAARLGRPLVTVACHDETSAVDLIGRWLVVGGDTVWQDGPVTRAVREGAILYLDEFAEARSDVLVVVHPLTDHRRRIFVERHDEELEAAPGFLLVASYNPGYQRGLKELKPSTRQRFVTLSFDYPAPEVELEILQQETSVDPRTGKAIVALLGKLRAADTLALAAAPSTRLGVAAARLIRSGVPPRAACAAAIVEPLTDDPEIAAGLHDLAALVF
jgi:nitric oxide reductase NorQ protein